MKRPVITAFDDLIYTETGENIPADHEEVPLMVGRDLVYLDLSDTSYKHLVEILEPFFKAGRKPMDDGPDLKGKTWSKAEYRDMRAFADKNGFSYKTPSGRYYYYPVTLQRAFLKSLRGDSTTAGS